MAATTGTTVVTAPVAVPSPQIFLQHFDAKVEELDQAKFAQAVKHAKAIQKQLAQQELDLENKVVALANACDASLMHKKQMEFHDHAINVAETELSLARGKVRGTQRRLDEAEQCMDEKGRKRFRI